MTRATHGTDAPARESALELAGTGMRRTGIDVIGDAPWGTHFCQFYATKDDLNDVLVPYFKAGLEADEFCMWVTSPPLDVGEAWDALAKAVPDLDSYRAARAHRDHPAHRVVPARRAASTRTGCSRDGSTKLEDALARGCAGLRLTGNTFWLEKSDWRSFADYEAAVDRVLGQYRMLALCTYSLDRCGASEVADVIRNHQFALIKRDGTLGGVRELRPAADAGRARRRARAPRRHAAEHRRRRHHHGHRGARHEPEPRGREAHRLVAGGGIGQARRRGVPDRQREDGRAGGRSRPGGARCSGRSSALANHVALVTRDGAQVSIADSAAPIRGRDGMTLGVVLVFRDVTAERRAEEALRDERATRQAEAGEHPLSRRRHREPGARRHRRRAVAPGAHGRVLQARPRSHGGDRSRGQGPGRRGMAGHLHQVPPRPSRDVQALHRERHPAHRRRPPRANARLYKCKNNMWDIATPLVVGGHHVGNVFMGQFFFDDERLDYELFQAQAARYGFDREEYLAALDAVPRLSRETVAVGMAFFLKLSAMLSQLSYSNVKLARSITDREALMNSLRESKERLEEADRRKDEFLGMLSHELRNPLAPIRNSIYILNHADPAGEQSRRAKAVIERQAEQLTRLVDDLLDVTRIARGKVELRRDRVDLAQLVRRAGEDHGGAHARARHRDGRGGASPSRCGRRGCGAPGPDGRKPAAQLPPSSRPAVASVTLALEAVRGAAEIHVRDTGAGMEPDLLTHVFDPFVQAERTLARTSGGLGLGLALVKGLTEMHGGSVRAASAGPGQGSEFVVRLPLIAGSHRRARPRRSLAQRWEKPPRPRRRRQQRRCRIARRARRDVRSHRRRRLRWSERPREGAREPSRGRPL